ncbi:MAG: hypothetical protein CM15mP86_19590 [Gammaproteobacteria bacterium]|nr:MAG: hypothetical protein CM15mP86_19590 [Gammaproteobacteria bacterium]
MILETAAKPNKAIGVYNQTLSFLTAAHKVKTPTTRKKLAKSPICVLIHDHSKGSFPKLDAIFTGLISHMRPLKINKNPIK